MTCPRAGHGRRLGIGAGPAIAALAVAVRIAVPIFVFLIQGDLARCVQNDSAGYLSLAENLLHTGRYALAGAAPENFRPPGYPLLLTAAVATPFPVAAALLINALLGGATVLAVFGTASRIGGPRAARWAALLCAFEPAQVIMSGFVLTEPLFALAVAAMGYAGLRFLASGELRWAAVLGLAAAGAAFTRVIAYFAPAWIAVTLLLRRASLGARLRGIAAFLAAAAVPIGAWQARNYFATGYAGFSTQIELHLVFVESAAVEAGAGGVSLAEARREQAEQVGLSPANHDAANAAAPQMRRRFVDRFRADPFSMAMVHARGVLVTLLEPGGNVAFRLFDRGRVAHASLVKRIIDGGWEPAVRVARREEALLLATEGALLLLLLLGYAFAARGLLSAPGRREALWLASLAIYLLLLAGGPYGQMRFRAPLMPLVCVLAGLGLAPWSRRTAKTGEG